jgi:O-antigen/teichoic acid export membrane protein
VPSAYGFAFAAGSAVAALCVLPALRRSALGLPAPDTAAAPDGMGRSLLYLIGAIALSQLLANLAPVVVTYRSPDDLVAAAVFGSTFVLARVPLFLFAVLLPQVTRAVAGGRHHEVVRRLRQAIVLVAGLGLLGVAGCVWLGPWAAERLFNTAYRPSAGTLAMLAAATLVMMLALVVQPTLVALGRQRTVTIGWIAGSVVFLVVLVAGPEPIAAALAAQLAGPLVVLAVLLVGVLRALSTPSAGVGASPATGRR